jgi:hypothetical protein
MPLIYDTLYWIFPGTAKRHIIDRDTVLPVVNRYIRLEEGCEKCEKNREHHRGRKTRGVRLQELRSVLEEAGFMGMTVLMSKTVALKAASLCNGGTVATLSGGNQTFITIKMKKYLNLKVPIKVGKRTRSCYLIQFPFADFASSRF